MTLFPNFFDNKVSHNRIITINCINILNTVNIIKQADKIVNPLFDRIDFAVHVLTPFAEKFISISAVYISIAFSITTNAQLENSVFSWKIAFVVISYTCAFFCT